MDKAGVATLWKTFPGAQEGRGGEGQRKAGVASGICTQRMGALEAGELDDQLLIRKGLGGEFTLSSQWGGGHLIPKSS